MRILDHRLEGAWHGLSPNLGGTLRAPTLLVMHTTASGGEGPEGDADWFLRPEARASAHLVVGRNGKVLQVVPFDRKAWHAGQSAWGGRSQCNDFSIGIEIDNWGRLAQGAYNDVRGWAGQIVPPERVARLTHKHESQSSLWETFPEPQLAALEAVTRALLAAYPSICEIVGHDDIARGRKSDPGPAFPMDRFQALLAPPEAGEARTVTASRLNARAGPGLYQAVIGRFPKGRRVNVTDTVAGWSRASGILEDGRAATAWVAERHLS